MGANQKASVVLEGDRNTIGGTKVIVTLTQLGTLLAATITHLAGCAHWHTSDIKSTKVVRNNNA